MTIQLSLSLSTVGRLLPQISGFLLYCVFLRVKTKRRATSFGTEDSPTAVISSLPRLVERWTTRTARWRWATRKSRCFIVSEDGPIRMSDGLYPLARLSFWRGTTASRHGYSTGPLTRCLLCTLRASSIRPTMEEFGPCAAGLDQT